MLINVSLNQLHFRYFMLNAINVKKGKTTSSIRIFYSCVSCIMVYKIVLLFFFLFQSKKNQIY